MLVDKVYTNLPMLRGATYAETDIGRFLRQTNDGALISGASNLTEAEQEILRKLGPRSAQHSATCNGVHVQIAALAAQ